MTNSFPPASSSSAAPPVSPFLEAPAVEEKKIKELARPYRGKVVDTLLAVLDNPKAADSNKIRAAEILAAYSDGKPKQEVETVHRLTYQDLLKEIRTKEERFQEAIADVEVIDEPPKLIAPPLLGWGDVL